jgi:hypothetical protein
VPRPLRWPRLLPLLLLGLLGVRWALEPVPPPWPRPPLPATQAAALRDTLSAERLDEAALADRLAPAEVLRVGEDHFFREPPAYLTRLLEALHLIDPRPLVLLLELPASVQRHLDRYRATGEEAALAAIWPGTAGALPYGALARWARARADVVGALRAIDEAPWHVVLMRALRTDTRNETMAAAIRDARAHYPGARVVAYGGASHMARAGRYLLDVDSRRPVGARLLAEGLPPAALACLWLAADRGPLAAAFPGPGAYPLTGALGTLPMPLLSPVPVFGVDRPRDLLDYAVALGPLTRVPEER